MSLLAASGVVGLAALLHLLELALSVMTLSASALSRVALRRMNTESGNRLPFLEEFKTVPSSPRAAIHILRQLALISAVALWGSVAAAFAWPGGWWTGIALGAFVGALLIETVAARMIALKDPRMALRFTAILVRPVHAVTYPVLGPAARGVPALGWDHRGGGGQRRRSRRGRRGVHRGRGARGDPGEERGADGARDRRSGHDAGARGHDAARRRRGAPLGLLDRRREAGRARFRSHPVSGLRRGDRQHRRHPPRPRSAARLGRRMGRHRHRRPGPARGVRPRDPHGRRGLGRDAKARRTPRSSRTNTAGSPGW